MLKFIEDNLIIFDCSKINLEFKGKKISGYIISDSFIGINHIRRQDILHKFLKDILSESDYLKIGYIAIMTHEEID